MGLRIVDVEVAWITLPLPVPRGLSGGPISHSTDLVVRITTDDGLRGIGEGRGASLPVMAEVAREALTPLLLGQDAAATQALWTRMHRPLLGPDAGSGFPSRWDRRAILSAIAAVDLALWDLKAQAAGLSICRLLGGEPRPVPAYISSGFFVEGQSIPEMAEETLEEVRRGGFWATKIRVGRGGIEDDIARVRAVREAVGPDVQLMVDANQAWDAAEGARRARALEPFNLTWLEEPVPSPGRTRRGEAAPVDWDAQCGEIAAATRIPLASGENHVSLAECRDLIQKGGVRFMQFDCVKNGGVTEFLKVAALCEAQDADGHRSGATQGGGGLGAAQNSGAPGCLGLDGQEHTVLMAPHHVPHFHVQLAAALPHAFMVEYFHPEKQHPAWLDLFEGYPEVRDGRMAVHDSPGWGMTINDRFLRENGTLLHWRS
jgi:L-alanine-DL-glutamate epimerase-like enolase superfamily enzyme